MNAITDKNGNKKIKVKAWKVGLEFVCYKRNLEGGK